MKQDFNRCFHIDSSPGIRKEELTGLVLKVLSTGTDIWDFGFINPPPAETVLHALDVLNDL
jgi:HrpA-like RNA helicase